MWGSFVLTVVVILALLYVPGYLFFRGLGFSRVLALCCAPLASVVAYTTLSIAYYELGISCSPATVALPALFAGVAFLALTTKLCPHMTSIDFTPQQPIAWRNRRLNFDALVLALCVLVGCVVCVVMFVTALPHADAFYSRNDNQTHLNLVKAFLDSGKWSVLHTSSWLASTPEASPMGSTTGSFYPAAWHVVVVLACSITSAPVTVGTNAMFAALCAVTFPSCMYAFIRALMSNSRATLLSSPLVVCASALLPWTFLLRGPTWPDMFGNTLVCAVLGTIVLLVNEGYVQTARIRFVCFSVLSFFSLALVHPNALFTVYVFMAAFGAHILWNTAWPIRRRLLALVGYVVLIIMAWVGLHYVPLIRSVVDYSYLPVKGIGHALKTALTLSFSVGRRQIVLALALTAGTIVCIRTKRWWLLFAPAFFLVCYVACMVGFEPLKYWLACFWYQVPNRCATRFMTFALPLVALGAAESFHLIKEYLVRRNVRHVQAILAGLVTLVCVANYAPLSFSNAQGELGYETSFGKIHRLIATAHSDDIEKVYSTKEIAFVNRVVATIGNDPLVINSPDDGTVWAYAVNGLNTYFRSRKLSTLQSEDAKLIRKQLCDISKNKAVHETVRRTGAQYVLLLDKGVAYEDGVWLPEYSKGAVKHWKGIDSIDDDTPGFELVLSEGDDMRLYRIVGV